MEPTYLQSEPEEKVGQPSVFLPPIIFLGTIIIIIVAIFFSFLFLPPFDFPKDKTITVKSGATLNEVSFLLGSENIIRSKSLFELCSKIVGGRKPILAGQYLFNKPISVCSVAFRIAHGISGIPPVRVTIPEGMSNKETARVLASKLSKFNSAIFLSDTQAKEGYLFPDTYLFSDAATTEDVERVMTENFNKKVEPLTKEIEASKHTLREIIIMASILEKEATTEEDKAIVSGILWNRISIGMPLQVDASFLYLLGKKSSELTTTDLQMKSDYNTYTNRGLPSGPIGNPGLLAIRAAIHPTSSSYLYYLSDKDGVMHYTKTFAEHVANKAKYLR